MKDRMLTNEDLQKILNRKQTYCYKVIRELNQELKEQGYYINPGRVPAHYLSKRMGIDFDDLLESLDEA